MANNSEHNGDHITVGQIEDGRAIAIGRGATAVYQGLSVEEVALLVTELRRVDQPKAWDGRTPYLGLSAFQESDAEFFFGRESLVDDLLLRVTAANFIVIAGPSGSGKSSVARAGLFHALRNGRLPRSDQWRLAIMQPGNDPIEQLALAIERLTHTPGAGNHIRNNGLGDRLALRAQIQTLLSDDPRQRFVLLVDQFEELFTQTKNEAARVAFIDLLTTAAQTPQSRMIILPAIRADFISHSARYPELRALMSQQFQLVGAMEAHDLAKAITLPALEVGAEIDPALVSQIMADMKGEPGTLPLMSFALHDLFDVEKTAKGKPMDLTLPEYRQRGGIEMALERHANKVFASFTAEQQALAKIIFSRLIEVGQGRVDTRRTAVLAELVPTGQNADEVAQVIERFAREGARLLTTDKGESEKTGVPTQTTVTIAHEKLIDAWPWLRQLVDENREAINLQNQIATDAQLWTREQDLGYLYRGGRLAQVEERLVELQPGLSALSQQFVDACLEAKTAEQKAVAEQIQKEEALRQEQANAGRFRRLTKWLSAAAGVALVATLIALFFLNQANSARNFSDANAALANTESARAVAAQATADFNAIIATTREAEARTAESEARIAEATSEANAALASIREAEVQRLKTFVQASQLALMAQAELAKDPERALLVATAGLGFNIQPDTHRQLAINLQTPYRTTLYGHDGAVRSAIFSPDGQTILTASDDGTARLWAATGAEAGSEIAVFRGHERTVESADFSPDGQTILTVGADGTARLWAAMGAEVGKELFVLHGHEGAVWSVAFSPDGQSILTVSDDGTTRLWAATGTEVGQELAVLRGLENWVNSAVFSPDGQTIVTANGDGTARLWAATGTEVGQELAVLRGHERWVESAVFSPDGQMILTASSDGTARLWAAIGAEAGSEIAVLRGHERTVASADFSPDGQTILTVGADGTARLWAATGAEAGSELAVLRHAASGQYEPAIISAVFSPDGQMIVTTSNDGTAQLWAAISTVGMNELAVLRGHEDGVWSAVFSPDGQTILTASDDGTARLWTVTGLEAGSTLAVLRGHQDGVLSATFSPDGQTIVTASYDRTARLWTATGAEVGNELAILSGHGLGVCRAIFSPDGQMIMTAGADGTARLWAATGIGVGSELVILRGHEDMVWSAVFSPDGQTILTASGDGTARLWAATGDEMGSELAVLRGHEGGVYQATFSSNGQMIVTTSDDGTARLWVATGAEMGSEIAVLHGHEDGIWSAAFSPDGQTILTTSDDGTAQLWAATGAEMGSEIAVLHGHEDGIWSAVFSPDGQTILTTSDDGTARLWAATGVEIGQELAVLRGHEGLVLSAVFSPDGQTILTSSADGTARLWPDSQYMVSVAYQRIQRGFTEAECQQFFRDDLAVCPQSKKALFAPLVEYLSPVQQAAWAELEE